MASAYVKRSPRRRSIVLAGVCVAALVAAYGCGDTPDDAPLEPSSDPDATSPDGTATPDAAHDSSIPGETSTNDGTPSDAGGGAEASLDGGDGGGDASSDAAVEAGIDAGPLSTTYFDYAINHVLLAGQSNVIGSGARTQNTLPLNTIAYTNAQPYSNVMFDVGVMTSGPKPGVAGGTSCNGSGCPQAAYKTPASFVPLIENDSFFDDGVRETPSSVMANEMSYLALTKFQFGARAGYPTKHDILVSNHGRSGQTYWCLRKGTCNYKPGDIAAFSEALLQVQKGKELATLAGKSYVVRAVGTVHGESDHYGYQDNADDHPEFPLNGTDGTVNKIQEYDDALIEWQQDYEASIKAITGQVQPVPLFVTGLSGWTGQVAAHRTSKLANLQLSAHVRAPGKVVYVAPGYIFEGAVQSNGDLECLHYSMTGERHIGAYFAKAYAQIVLKGQPFEPVRPLSVARVANVVTVKFHVPVPPLKLDATRVAMIANYGFDFVDNGTIVAISNVAVNGNDEVIITLAAAPSAATKRLRYAQNQPLPGCTGPGVKSAGGARGNLRDSDPAQSASGFDLFNWSANFDLAVP
jgi:hypothetical protein